ncbi:MFS transporter [Microscilla marina]|uniref:Major facilitator family transporter n=1 Tax=Microscilla marina ATCC 23134 TaxID=313606 RepID=A1ZFX4_MICM2|nr:MFS transporter [Microscilla marina]EAY30898.1 major facilitator family transporter [Microscilla marina ATCC 23134]
MKKNSLPHNVILLGFVSLFSDISSQMVYPLLAPFLKSLGATVVLIGLIEGIAETTAALCKTFAGRLSDLWQKRKIFVLLGYGLSNLSKPFLYGASVWSHVLGVRFADRVGKAVRNPPRDALIAGSVDKTQRGKAFGWHLALDRTGALLGPLIALLILSLSLNNMRLVFLLSIVPGVIAIGLVFWVKEVKIHQPKQPAQKQTRALLGNRSFMLFWIACMLFTLGNSSNAFLILKAQEVHFSTTAIVLLWTLYNLVCTLAAPVLGNLSDKVGRKPLIALSFLYYAGLYALFAFAQAQWMIWTLFGAYGIYYGLSKGIFKAYIADLVPDHLRATAYGLFNTGLGIALLPASLLMGAIWTQWSSQWAFLVSACFSLLGCSIFLVGYKGDNEYTLWTG